MRHKIQSGASAPLRCCSFSLKRAPMKGSGAGSKQCQHRNRVISSLGKAVVLQGANGEQANRRLLYGKLEMIRMSMQSRIANTRIICEVDEVGFAKIVELHRAQVFRFLFASLRDVDLAETLTQDCLLRAVRNWPSFRGDSNVMTWLTRIAINVRNDYWRNRRARFWRQATANSVDIDAACEWLPSPEASSEARLAAREQLQQVWKLSETLTKKQRTVFLMRYFEERTLNDIAHATGLSEGTVKAHLYRAIARIRCGVTTRESAGCIA